MRSALALAVLLAGCAGSNDINIGGVYLVVTDVSSAPCGSDSAIPAAPPYVHLKNESTGSGASVWLLDACWDAAATRCQSGGGFYVEPIDNGWQGIESMGSFSGTSCYLGYVKDTAILKNTMLVINDTEYADTPALDQAHCTTAEAEKRGTTMPCVNHVHIEATKL